MKHVIEALGEITPAGLFDVCRSFGFDMYTKDGSIPVCNMEQADNLNHDNTNREEIINLIAIDKDISYNDIAEHLGI